MEILATAPATTALLVVNVALSLYTLLVRPDLIEAWSLRPYDVVERRDYQRLFTAGFLHTGLGHLFFNMLTLYFIGPPLERALGLGRFLALYFGSELVSSLYTVWRQRRSTTYSAIGASGAISGLMFALVLFAPFAMFYVFFAIPMPAIVFAVLYVGGSIYAMRQSEGGGAGGGIAHEAHLGGAVGGLVLTLLLEPSVGPHFLRQIGLG